MIAIIDYDAGNTFNVRKALAYIGLDDSANGRFGDYIKCRWLFSLPGVAHMRRRWLVLKERGLSRCHL